MIEWNQVAYFLSSAFDIRSNDLRQAKSRMEYVITETVRIPDRSRRRARVMQLTACSDGSGRFRPPRPESEALERRLVEVSSTWKRNIALFHKVA
jgi:hypothetical protein